MNPEDIGHILDEIGERIGPAGEYAWTTLVMGERINGILSIALGLVLAVITAVLVRLAFWAYRKHSEGPSYDSHDIGMVALSLAAGGVGIFALMAIGFGLPMVFIPEYTVLRDLIGAVR